MESLHHLMNMNPAAADQFAGDRFPPWSLIETREFLSIRAELDQAFMETKRSKLLWDIISSKMKDKGFIRTADQCKCMWKNLVTRYKGCETMEPEIARQSPFYEELRAVFDGRVQRILWLEAQGGASSSTIRKGLCSSSEEDNSIGDGDAAERVEEKKKRPKPSAQEKDTPGGGLQEALQEFIRQLVEMDAQWRRDAEAREEKRMAKEMEHLQAMEALQRERMLMNRRWKEREEQRLTREEARAEKRDALIGALLNKFMRDGI